jgi:arylsulfatase A-like enzyme
MLLVGIATLLISCCQVSAAFSSNQIPLHDTLKTRSPSIVFFLLDDLDYQLQSLDYLPFVQKHLVEKGTLYEKHFCTTALCCPSRVSLWTGKAAHNTNVTDVNPPYGRLF